ncbi:DNA repair protein RAD51 homolog 4 isoform X4 [Periplaneta americana]|uniref:DNA repair protein RAD51 homolog 4 isoform X4 n=1 Tax=Periplaneta americana TaxID=6978 RepID=UPI0037E7C57D
MARLCTQMSPLLQENILDKLHCRKIFTVIDILQENTEKLVEITKLPYRDIIQLRQSIVAYYAAFPRKGIDIYNEVMSYTALIPTGIESLDNIIEGGLMTGKVYEVCGPSGSGKTQLCLTISTHIANCYKQQVHYIDTKADFSGMRVEEMLTSCGYLDEERSGSWFPQVPNTELAATWNGFYFINLYIILKYYYIGIPDQWDLNRHLRQMLGIQKLQTCIDSQMKRELHWNFELIGFKEEKLCFSSVCRWVLHRCE